MKAWGWLHSDVGRHRTIPRHNMCVRGHDMPRPSAKERGRLPCFDKLVELLLGISSACPRRRGSAQTVGAVVPQAPARRHRAKARCRHTLTEGAQAHGDAEATPLDPSCQHSDVVDHWRLEARIAGDSESRQRVRAQRQTSPRHVLHAKLGELLAELRMRARHEFGNL